MSSSMETELLKSGAEGEHTTWKERDRAKWEEKREGCKMAETQADYFNNLAIYCKATSEPCGYDLCPFAYWLGMRSQ